MKKYLYQICALLLVVVALIARTSNLTARAPFDWDQNRDYQAIESISRGNLSLIGPVAKGEGGFFLGPLYYYLALPAFLISSGAPQSLPMTSVLLDLLAIILILTLFPRVSSQLSAFLVASVWTFSFFAIEQSKISWNVSLLPLFSILLLYFSSLPNRSRLINLIFGIVLGLTWHIHASLIPLVPIFTLTLLLFKKLKIRELPLLFAGYIIPLLPLILFDLRHNFLNLHLLINFAKASSISSPELSLLVYSVLSRFGKVIYNIFFVRSDLHFWWGLGFCALAIFSLFRGSVIAKISAIIIYVILILVLSLREIGFAEYYLGVSYLPVIVILIEFFLNLPKHFKFIPIIILAYVYYLNIVAYTTTPTGFSLGQKQAIVSAIASRAKQVDLRYDLPFGRDTGFNLLLPGAGVTQDSSSPTKIVISEKMSERLFIDGEITEDLGYFGGMHVGIRVIQ